MADRPDSLTVINDLKQFVQSLQWQYRITLCNTIASTILGTAAIRKTYTSVSAITGENPAVRAICTTLFYS